MRTLKRAVSVPAFFAASFMAVILLAACSNLLVSLNAPGTGGGDGSDGVDWVTISVNSFTYSAGNYSAYVTDGFTLPVQDSTGAVITWTASPSGVLTIADDGTVTVTRPTDNTTVTLTATKGTETKTFVVAVKGTAAPTARRWRDISSSADGMKLLAAHEGGKLYLSEDGGGSWKELTSANNSAWRAVFVSADGTFFAASTYSPTYSYIKTSRDGGVNWDVEVFPTNPMWRALALTGSADGRVLIAGSVDSKAWISTDSGANWNQASYGDAYGFGVMDVACSSDGQIQYVLAGSTILKSTDSGATWSETGMGSHIWEQIAGSANGQKIAVAMNTDTMVDGYIQVSTDAGATAVEKVVDARRTWVSVTASSDLATIFASANVGNSPYLVRSTDGGTTWTALATPSSLEGDITVATSMAADGLRVAMVSWDYSLQTGFIYTSPDGGVTWYQQY